MSNTKSQEVVINTSPGLFFLFVVFLALKLTGTVTWSWWIVTMPLWIGFVLMLSLVFIALVIASVATILVAIAHLFK